MIQDIVHELDQQQDDLIHDCISSEHQPECEEECEVDPEALAEHYAQLDADHDLEILRAHRRFESPTRLESLKQDQDTWFLQMHEEWMHDELAASGAFDYILEEEARDAIAHEDQELEDTICDYLSNSIPVHFPPT
jgi:hypothetical protein